MSHPKADWPAKPPARVSPLVGGGRCAAVLGPVIQPAAHTPSPLMPSAPTPLTFFPARPLGEVDAVVMQAAPHRDRAGVGFRRGDVGTHTSRTIMLAELGTLFDAVPAAASEEEIAVAIRQANCLGKQTAATRRSTRQRLAELYGLDPHVPVYRVLRRLWQLDVADVCLRSHRAVVDELVVGLPRLLFVLAFVSCGRSCSQRGRKRRLLHTTDM